MLRVPQNEREEAERKCASRHRETGRFASGQVVEGGLWQVKKEVPGV